MIDYKTASKNELLKEFERLKKVTNDTGAWTKKEFLHFPEIAMPDETPLAVSSGSMDGKTWLIILTNKRVVFLDKGMIYGLKQIAVDLSSISSVGCQTKLLFGLILITAGGKNYSIEYISKKTVVPFTNLVKQAMEEAKHIHVSPVVQQAISSDDMVSKLERLAVLKEKGIITEEEFQDQKAKILG